MVACDLAKVIVGVRFSYPAPNFIRGIMKSLLLALSLVPTLTFADAFEAQKPVICDDAKATIVTFEKKFGEKPMLVFKGKETMIIITMNF